MCVKRFVCSIILLCSIPVCAMHEHKRMLPAGNTTHYGTQNVDQLGKHLLQLCHESDSKSDVSSVQELLNKKVDPNYTALLYGEVRYSMNALCRASFNGSTGIVTCLLNAKAGVNNATQDGRTPLAMACHLGHESVVKELLKHKAHPNIAQKDKTTPLSIAALWDHGPIVTLLLLAKADKAFRKLFPNGVPQKKKQKRICLLFSICGE